jgi:hypothetical protein
LAPEADARAGRDVGPTPGCVVGERLSIAHMSGPMLSRCYAPQMG